jgi:hypothetical protein
MRELIEEIKLKITHKEAMEIKDAYDLFDIKSVIKFIFEKAHPNKEVAFDKGWTLDSDPVNGDVMLVTLKARSYDYL